MCYCCLSQYKNLTHSLCRMSSLQTFLQTVFYLYFRKVKFCIQYICIFPHFITNMSIFNICDSFLNNIIIWFYLSVISVLCALLFFFFTLFFKTLKERRDISVICGWMTLDEYLKSKLQKSLRNLCNRCMFIIQRLLEKNRFFNSQGYTGEHNLK